LKVPRQCPIVLLVEARFVFGICSILIFKDVGAAVVASNYPVTFLHGPNRKQISFAAI
jgi:hypothetical protein